MLVKNVSWYIYLSKDTALLSLSQHNIAQCSDLTPVKKLPHKNEDCLASPFSLCAKCSRHVVIRHVKSVRAGRPGCGRADRPRGRRAGPRLAGRRCSLTPHLAGPSAAAAAGHPHSGPHTLKERTKAKLFGSLSRSHVASSDGQPRG